MNGLGLMAVRALVTKSMRLAKNDQFRLFDITIWPVTFFISVTFLTSFLSNDPRMLAMVALGTVGWRAVYHFSNEICDLYRIDYWGSCIDQLLVTPVKTFDFVAAGAIIGAVKLAFVVGVFAILAAFLFPLPAINIPAVFAATAILGIFGIELGLLLLGVYYYYGDSAFAISYAITDVVAVFSGVYYPLALVPEILRPFALALPSTHAFSLMKSTLGIESFDPVLAVVTLVGWGVLALWTHNRLLEKARKQGRLLKIK